MGSKFSAKQAFWFSVINYIGVLIGTLSTFFIYPKDKELFGIVRYIDSFAQIFYPIMLFGSSVALLHYYPLLDKLRKRKLFTYNLFSIGIISGIAATITWILFQWREVLNPLYAAYGFIIGIFLAYIDLYKRQGMNLERVAVPSFYEKIIPKIGLPLLFILIIQRWISKDLGLILYIVLYFIVLILLFLYISKFFKPLLTFHFNDLFTGFTRKDYYKYSLYAFTASIGSFFAFRADALMIPELTKDYTLNGIYGIGVNVANALMIPATGVFALYSPLISENLKKNNWDFIKIKYKEVARNLFWIGMLLYGLLIIGLADIISTLPLAESLQSSLPIIYILGISVLINMGSGFNTEIIAYSDWYRFNLIPIGILIFFNVGLNYYILTQTQYGITGVAFISLISMLLFNLIKGLFIYRKLNMHPFDPTYLYIILMYMISLSVCFLLPDFDFPVWNVLYKCGLYVFLTFTISFRFRLFYPLNQWIKKFIYR